MKRILFFSVMLLAFLEANAQVNFVGDGNSHIKLKFDYKNGKPDKIINIETQNVVMKSNGISQQIKSKTLEDEEFVLRVEGATKEKLVHGRGGAIKSILSLKEPGIYKGYLLFYKRGNSDDKMYDSFGLPSGKRGTVEIIKYEKPYVYLKFEFNNYYGKITGICEKIKFKQ